MTQISEPETLLTEGAKKLVGVATDVMEMYGEVDQETVRRFIHGIPDQDPIYWDEKVAKPRFGGIVAPPLMPSYIGGRKPPWEEDRMGEVLREDPFSDGGGGMGRKEKTLPSIRTVAPTRSHLHAGDEIEIRQFPKLGDRIFYQSRWVDVQEKKGRDGRPFLLVTRETRYWNQKDELLLVVRGLGIERP